MPSYRLLAEWTAPDRQVRLIVDAIPPILSPLHLLQVNAAVRQMLPPMLPPDGYMGSLVRSSTATGYLYRYAASLGVLVD